jgi:hypothetical protein
MPIACNDQRPGEFMISRASSVYTHNLHLVLNGARERGGRETDRENRDQQRPSEKNYEWDERTTR